MDNIADFLIRIKNSSFAGKYEVVVPFTTFNLRVAEILEKEGFLVKVAITEEEGHKKLALRLAGKGAKPTRIEVVRLSKPGCRVYFKTSDLNKLRGLWTVIVSTPEGLLTAQQARKKNLGGEAICKICKI